MKKLLIIFILLSSLFAKSEPVTKEDMQMMFGMFQKSIDAKLENLETQIKMTNTRINDLDKKLSQRIDDVYSIMVTLLGGIFVLIGFMWWDRRTLIYKAKEEMEKEFRERGIPEDRFGPQPFDGIDSLRKFIRKVEEEVK